MKLALIGRNIAHSRSQQMYEKLLDHPVDYTLLDYENEGEIPTAKKLLNEFDGISITAPYKTHFLKQVKLTSGALQIGAINCLHFRPKDGQIYGTNTDLSAFEEIFVHEKSSKSIFILIILALFSLTIYLEACRA